MHHTIELGVPATATDELLDTLNDLDGVLSLSVERGASIKPPGDMITVHALDPTAADWLVGAGGAPGAAGDHHVLPAGGPRRRPDRARARPAPPPPVRRAPGLAGGDMHARPGRAEAHGAAHGPGRGPGRRRHRRSRTASCTAAGPRWPEVTPGAGRGSRPRREPPRRRRGGPPRPVPRAARRTGRRRPGGAPRARDPARSAGASPSPQRSDGPRCVVRAPPHERRCTHPEASRRDTACESRDSDPRVWVASSLIIRMRPGVAASSTRMWYSNMLSPASALSWASRATGRVITIAISDRQSSCCS